MLLTSTLLDGEEGLERAATDRRSIIGLKGTRLMD